MAMEEKGRRGSDPPLARALRFLSATPLIDGHNDLPYLIRRDAAGDVMRYDLRRRVAGRDTDLPRLRAGRVAGQVWAAFVPPREPSPASFALQQIAIVRRMCALHPESFRLGRRSDDLFEAHASNRIACYVSIENGAAIEGRLDTLDAFHALGVRLMTLCHNATTDWCDSATDAPRHGGLTAFGRTVIDRMNSLGMIVDLSHTSDDVMRQTLDRSRAPVVFSHSNVRTLCDHRRNVPDDVLDLARDRGAIVMATFVPDFISQKSKDWLMPFRDAYGKLREDIDANLAVEAREREAGRWPRGTLRQFCDHLDYLRARMGADHVGIGSDFFGGPQGAGLEDVSCFPAIIAELFTRGWRDTDVEKLVSGNFLRVFREVEQVAEGRLH
jgi:membrane dipeptidase